MYPIHCVDVCINFKYKFFVVKPIKFVRTDIADICNINRSIENTFLRGSSYTNSKVYFKKSLLKMYMGMSII